MLRFDWLIHSGLVSGEEFRKIIVFYFSFIILLKFEFITFIVGGRDFNLLKSRFAHVEISSLNFSSSSFVIRVNLLHP